MPHQQAQQAQQAQLVQQHARQAQQALLQQREATAAAAAAACSAAGSAASVRFGRDQPSLDDIERPQPADFDKGTISWFSAAGPCISDVTAEVPLDVPRFSADAFPDDNNITREQLQVIKRIGD